MESFYKKLELSPSDTRTLRAVITNADPRPFVKRTFFVDFDGDIDETRLSIELQKDGKVLRAQAVLEQNFMEIGRDTPVEIHEEGDLFNTWKINGYAYEVELCPADFKPVYALSCAGLPLTPSEDSHDIWSDGERILSGDEGQANHIADLLDALGFSAVTGYYDPEEDARNGDTDEYTGYWYIEI